MSSDIQELVRICEQLGESERAAVADFARFLLAKHDDAAWDGAARVIRSCAPSGCRPPALRRGVAPDAPRRKRSCGFQSVGADRTHPLARARQRPGSGTKTPPPFCPPPFAQPAFQ